jgi:hypothetical protein
MQLGRHNPVHCGSDTFNPLPIWEFREAYRWPSRPARSGPQSMPTPAGAWRDADGCCHREKELPETGSASRKVSFLDQPRSRDSGFARWKRNPAADFHRYAAAPGRLAEAIRTRHPASAMRAESGRQRRVPRRNRDQVSRVGAWSAPAREGKAEPAEGPEQNAGRTAYGYEAPFFIPCGNPSKE